MLQINDCLAAYTSPSINYPAYLSINYRNGGIEVTVRKGKKADGSCGETTVIVLPVSEFTRIIEDCALKLSGAS